MRNLKKILALVLAMVMSFSVMSIASASFKDASTISEEYATAVEALAALEVFKGYEDGNFNPKGTITRAEVAAIIYRIDTKDIEDKQKDIYSDYNKFDDVTKNNWFAGYVNYCANAEYVKGRNDTTFDPNGKVTGYEVLAMILRVVGYDQNNEFSGSGWYLEVASIANQLGITRNVTADTLGKNATRELVAELLYRAIVEARQVNYTLAFGYSEYEDLGRTVKNQTIEQEKIGMYLTTDDYDNEYVRDRYNALVPNTYYEEDIWGRPSEYWVANDWTKQVLADWSETPATFTTAVVECELATLLGLEEETVMPVWKNGVDPYKYKDGERVDILIGEEIEPLHTSNHKNEHKIGKQGTLMEVYSDRIVMVDTYLALVTDTVTKKTDLAGHVSRYPYNAILVFDNDKTNTIQNTIFAEDKIIGETFKVSGNDYATDEYLLVNVYEGKRDLVKEGINENNLFIVGNPEELTGKQTKIWWNAEKHAIEGNEYSDSINYVLDAAGFDKDTAYRWFFADLGDGVKYVIGSANLPTEAVAAQYAVVLGAQWINSGKYAEKGYAYGTVQYLDGSEPTETLLYGLWDGKTYDAKTGAPAIKEFEYADTNDADFQDGKLCTTYQYNKETWKHLYQVMETEAGLVLIEVKNELKAAKLYDGVSKIDTDEAEIYTDNETVYFFLNYETGKLDSIKGYDNLNKKFDVELADVVNGKFAAQFIYLPFYEEITEKDKDTTSYGYYFLTDDAMSYALKDSFLVLGVVDGKGSTEPLVFGMNYAGNATHEHDEDCVEDCEIQTVLVPGFENVNNLKGEALTEAYLEWFAETHQNKLFLVKFVNGMVDEMTEVEALDAVEDEYSAAMFVDSYEFIETGVLKVLDGEGKVAMALNVNNQTTIINLNGVGTKDDLVNLEGEDLYVIYSGTAASAIFVVPHEEA